MYVSLWERRETKGNTKAEIQSILYMQMYLNMHSLAYIFFYSLFYSLFILQSISLSLSFHPLPSFVSSHIPFLPLSQAHAHTCESVSRREEEWESGRDKERVKYKIGCTRIKERPRCLSRVEVVLFVTYKLLKDGLQRLKFGCL